MPGSLSVCPQNICCMKQTKHQAHAGTRVHEIEDDNMSITHSISIVQTDNRVLKANRYVDYCFYGSLVKLSKGRQL